MTRLYRLFQRTIQAAGTALHDALLLAVSVPTFLVAMAWRGIVSGYRGGRQDAGDLTRRFWGDDGKASPAAKSD